MSITTDIDISSHQAFNETLEIPPVVGLERWRNQVLPFNVSNFKKTITIDHLQPMMITHNNGSFFQALNVRLKYIDQLRYLIRLPFDDDKLIVKMVTTEHEQMHGSLMSFIKMEMTVTAKRTQLQFFFSNNVELYILEEIDMLIRVLFRPPNTQPNYGNGKTWPTSTRQNKDLFQSSPRDWICFTISITRTYLRALYRTNV